MMTGLCPIGEAKGRYSPISGSADRLHWIECLRSRQTALDPIAVSRNEHPPKLSLIKYQ